MKPGATSRSTELRGRAAREQPDRRAHRRRAQPAGVPRAGDDVRPLARDGRACCSATPAWRTWRIAAPQVAGKVGGTIRVGITGLRRLARAVPPQRGRLARVRRHSRRVPDLHEPAGPGRAVARDELEAERRRDRLDVPDPAGRQVPQRQDADRAGRRREHEAVRPREELERRSHAVLRPSRCLRDGGSTPSSSGSSRRSACSRTSSARRPTRRSSSRRRSLRSPVTGSRRDDRHRPVQGSRATSTRRAPCSSATTPTGAAGRRSTASGSPSTRAARRSCSRCARGQIDLAMQLSPQEAPAVQEQLAVHVLRSSRPRRTGRSCMRTDLGPLQGRTGPPGGRARDQPAAAARAVSCSAPAQIGNDTPVLARLRVDRPVGRSSDAEPRPRAVAAAGGRAPRT